MAEIKARAGDFPGRRRNRRKALDRALEQAQTPRDVIAAAAAYFRSVFVRADAETAKRVARELIDMTEREAGETR